MENKRINSHILNPHVTLQCDVSPNSTLKTQLSVASSLGITGQADVPAGHQSPGLPVKQSLTMGGQLMGSRITGGSGSSLVIP